MTNQEIVSRLRALMINICNPVWSEPIEAAIERLLPARGAAERDGFGDAAQSPRSE